MRCGEIPQCRSCPRNCKRSFAIQLSHWTCPASLGRRIARRPRARRPAADGYQLVRRWVDGRGGYGFPELCCRLGGNRCFGMLYWRRTRAIESRPTPSSGGQSRRAFQTSTATSPSHQPGQPTRAGTEQSWLSTPTVLRPGRYTQQNARTAQPYRQRDQRGQQRNPRNKQPRLAGRRTANRSGTGYYRDRRTGFDDHRRPIFVCVAPIPARRSS